MTTDRNEPMSAVDRAWLEMDTPRNPMVVSAVLEFSAPVDAQQLATTMADRIGRYPRFRRVVDVKHKPARWVDAEDFAALDHVRVVRLPGADARIRAAIEAEINKPLDRALPLWRLYVYLHRRGGATVLFRAHHALADGIALVQMLLHCTDAEQAAPVAASEHPAHTHHGPLGGLIDRLESVNTIAEKVRDFVIDDLRHPGWIPGHLREAREMLGTLGHVLTLPDDNPQQLHAPLSGRRAAAWSGGIALAPIRAAAAAANCTVNDIFLAAVAGAFARQLAATGTVDQAQNLRVSVPVNLRPSESGTLGNCFGLVLLDLPVGIIDPHERLRQVAARMRALKASPTARTVLLALAAAGHLPVVLEKKLVERVAGKSVAVVSNLRGPRQPMRVGGARIRSLVFWPPQAGGIGIGISLFSYGGKVSVGVSADVKLITQPEQWIAHFHSALAELLPANVSRSARQRRQPRQRMTQTGDADDVPERQQRRGKRRNPQAQRTARPNGHAAKHDVQDQPEHLGRQPAVHERVLM
jgi:diacylglycerol O-acyltransferase / wax synthase